MSFELMPDHQRWAQRARGKYGRTKEAWLNLIALQEGCCALSGAPLLFDAQSGTPVAGGQGAHPLYAAVDHIAPGRSDHGYQIVSYDLNDLKGHLPVRLFRCLQSTEAWQELMSAWREQALKDAHDRDAFRCIRS